jgi:chromosome partitioning protein
VWALDDIASLIEEARSVRDGLRAFALLNCADPGTASVDNAEAAAAVADVPQLEFLDTPIRRRKAFASALRGGPPAAGAFPAGQFLVAILRVLVSKPVELRESGVGRMSFVDTQLLAVIPIAGDQ